MSRADLRRASARLRFLGGVLGTCFLLLAARAAFLTVVDERGAARGRAQTGTVLRIASARGEIVDRTGAALAVTMSAPSVYAVPAEIDDPAGTARALARALGRSAAPIRERLEQASTFSFVARWLPEREARAVAALGLPGVGIVEEPRRRYPLGELGGRLLGFANIDGEGVRGIEQGEDAWLRGHERKIALERDARGRLLARSGVDPRAAAGGDVALTLDSALQAEAESALDEIVAMTGARGGVVVAMDPATGDLLAVAESPALDPAAFRTIPYGSTGSRAFLDAVEPGSTLKFAVVAAALEAGVLRPEERIHCEQGSYRVPGKTLRDVKPHGLLDAAGILRVSSNIGAAKISQRISPAEHHRALRALGFGSPTGSGFSNESAGLLRGPNGWRPLDQATISFGQGINVTPIQLAAAGAAIANRGRWRTPRLVSARREAGGDWVPEPVAASRPALRRGVADQVRAMLETVTGDDGTGRRATLTGTTVAGKTGTAQKFDVASGSYSQKDYQAWFLGMAPADDPRIVIVTMIDEPRGTAHGGGSTAAPLFARVAAAALARDGIVASPRYDVPALARIDRTPPRTVATVKTTPPAGPTPAEPRAETAAAGAAPEAEAAGPPEVAGLPEIVGLPEAAGLPEIARLPEIALAKPPQPAPGIPLPIRPTPPITWFGERVLLPDLRGLTPEQVKEITDGVPFSLELQGNGRVVTQDPAPGTILGANAALRVTLGGGEG